MKVLLLIFAVTVSMAVMFRRRLGYLRTLDWRSLIGFGFGALAGLAWSKLVGDTGRELANTARVPWPVFRLAFAVFGGILTAGPVRRILEDAFPRRTKDKERE